MATVSESIQTAYVAAMAESFKIPNPMEQAVARSFVVDRNVQAGTRVQGIKDERAQTLTDQIIAISESNLSDARKDALIAKLEAQLDDTEILDSVGEVIKDAAKASLKRSSW